MAIYQVLATIFVAVATVLVSFGLTMGQFGLESAMNTSHTDNYTAKQIQTFESNVRESGNHFVGAGIASMVVGIAFFILLILAESSKPKLKLNKSSKVLLDEMYDGKDIELKKKGWDAYSVKKLRLEGEALQYDYSVLKYVEENKMILITEDSESYGGCKENNLPCIKLGQNPSIDEIVKELDSLKTN